MPSTGVATKIRAAVAALAVAAVIAGCGGSSDSSTTSTIPGPTDLGSNQELQDCLAEHGLDSPTGAPDASGAQPSNKQMQAFEDCQQYMPEGMPAGGVPPSG